MKINNFAKFDYQAKASFSFNKEEMNELFEITYRKFLPLIQIPGFRKGKAPVHMAKLYIQQDKLLEEIFDKMIRNSIDLLVKEKPEHEFIFPPSLENEDYPEENNEFELKLLFDIFPEVNLSDIPNIEIKLDKTKTIEDVENELRNSLLEANANFEDLLDTPQLGNYAIVEYQFDPETDKSPKKTVMIELGKEQLLPDNDQEIMKMQNGEEKILSYQPKDLQDTMSVKVKVIGFKKKILPEFNQTFLDSIQAGKSLEEFNQQILSQATVEHDNFMKEAKWSAFFEAWFKDHMINNLPQSIMEHYQEQALELFKEDLASSKLTLEEFLAKTNKTEDALLEELKPRAIYKANVDLLLRSIMKSHPDLNPSKEEINNETQIYLGKFKKGALERKRIEEYCENILRRKKALDWILGQLEA